MASGFERKHLWQNSNFIVEKATLHAKAAVSSADLGHGIIYSPDLANVRRRRFDGIVVDFPRAGSTLLHPDLGLVWNPADETELVNDSDRSTDFLNIKLNYSADLPGLHKKDLPAAMGYLFHGKWSDPFEATLKADLDSIRLLAGPYAGELIFTGRGFVTGIVDHEQAILRATRAKEDLEFKLAWFAAAARKSSRPAHEFSLRDAFKLEHGADVSTPIDVVKVTVNTKGHDRVTNVPGYEVWANLYINADDEGPARRFNQLSTPTAKALPVALYSMWAKMPAPSSLTGPTEKISVGSLDDPFETDTMVDLIAP